MHQNDSDTHGSVCIWRASVVGLVIEEAADVTVGEVYAAGERRKKQCRRWKQEHAFRQWFRRGELAYTRQYRTNIATTEALRRAYRRDTGQTIPSDIVAEALVSEFRSTVWWTLRDDDYLDAAETLFEHWRLCQREEGDAAEDEEDWETEEEEAASE